MRIIGCDLHARQQSLAMLDTTTGEVVEVALKHEGDNVREFYAASAPACISLSAYQLPSRVNSLSLPLVQKPPVTSPVADC